MISYRSLYYGIATIILSTLSVFNTILKFWSFSI